MCTRLISRCRGNVRWVLVVIIASVYQSVPLRIYKSSFYYLPMFALENNGGSGPDGFWQERIILTLLSAECLSLIRLHLNYLKLFSWFYMGSMESSQAQEYSFLNIIFEFLNQKEKYTETYELGKRLNKKNKKIHEKEIQIPITM